MAAFAPSLAQFGHFGLKVIDELTKGENNAAGNNQAALVVSMRKLERYHGMLLRVIPVVSIEAVKEDLTDLAETVSAFITENSNTAESGESEDSVPVQRFMLGETSSRGGRPEYILSSEEMTVCHNTGMSWASMAKFFGVSQSTIYRNKWKVREDITVSNDELLETVAQCKSEIRVCGEKYVDGCLRANGKKATRRRIRAALRFIDPIGTIFRQRFKTQRRVYTVKGPMYLLHMDGNEKLQAFCLYIHGLIDGYSRKVIYLFVSSNKKAGTVLKRFRKCVRKFGFPKIVRSDKGGENIKVAEFILQHRGLSETSFITGKSVHNVRIERFWGEVNKISCNYRDLFMDMQDDGILNVDDPLHMLALNYVFIPRIQRSLNNFRKCWNFHKIRTAHNKTPEELFLTGTHPQVSIVDEDLGDDNPDNNDYDADFNTFASFAGRIIPRPLDGDGEENLTALINAIQAERNSLSQ